MKKIINKIFKEVYRHRIKRIERYMLDPMPFQEKIFKQLISGGRKTVWGKKFGYEDIKNSQSFASEVPIQNYESLEPFIKRMMDGEWDVLWQGQVHWFSKSSGTTSHRSKFLPVSHENLKECHIKGTWDTMTFFYNQCPDARVFELKSMLMGGSLSQYPHCKETTFGDVSAIMINKMPWMARPFFTPDFETALMPNFEEKIEKMAQITAREKDMVMIGGVPTWTLVLFRRILEITGADNMLEVWPNLQGYIHGGVSFTPHRKQFKRMLPSDKVHFQEIYNASEGYFAAQNDFSQEGMLLLVDNGIYYEFIPQEEWSEKNPKAIPLSEVEMGKLYGLVISTNSGLWRYTPGDTIEFTSLLPHKIKVRGRMTQFVNAFGEEVIAENTDQAIAMTCQELDVSVREYTVAPIYFEEGKKGGHEWIIEFEKSPINLALFNQLLDENLQKINSDYEAKRHKNMALNQLRLHPVPQGTFYNWLRSKGKFGGQHKVPRLSNDRRYVEDILGFMQNVS